MDRTVIFDPPSGWKYGFPRKVKLSDIDTDEKLRQYLLKNNYPENMIDLALKHSRYIG